MKPDALIAETLSGLSGQAKQDFLEGLRVLNLPDPREKAALRESVRKLMPNYTEAQIDVFIEGKAAPAKECLQ